tara:strand:+ start:285 stop:461 length:177 start_codon:yes stop_codon:yes gene_type:complete
MNQNRNPKNVKSLNVTIRMTEADIEKLDIIADYNDISRANAMRALVRKSRVNSKLLKD